MIDLAIYCAEESPIGWGEMKNIKIIDPFYLWVNFESIP